MNSANTLIHTYSPSSPFPHRHHNHNQCHHRKPLLMAPLSSFNSRGPRRRRTYRKNPKLTAPFTTTTTSSPSQDSKLQTVIDLDELSTQTSSFLHSKLHRFISSARDAYEDLQTLVYLDDNRRIMVSCRHSTVLFMGNLAIWGFVFVFAFKVLGKLALGLGRGGFGFGNEPVVVRRDRSLGGREVVVGSRRRTTEAFNRNIGGTGMAGSERVLKNRVRKLPKWWPVSVWRPGSVLNKHEYQREANRLIRVIVDNRMSGMDIMEDDIIQLRQICRASGVRVSIDTINIRDSIYRAAVDFVLQVCSRAPSKSTLVQIDGEDARQFVAGLAENVGIDNFHAARIVTAAVAARTRSRFLQAWALEIQGKHAEAKLELSKICLILRIFPPEESSPEMEMVARGLEKHLKIEQRQFLMNTLVGICGEESHRSATEALGLLPSPEDVSIQQEKWDGSM